MVFKNFELVKTNKSFELSKLFSGSAMLSKSISGWSVSKNTAYSDFPSITGSVYFAENDTFSVSYASENSSSVYSEYLPWSSLMSYMNVPYNVEDGRYDFYFNGNRITEAIIIEFEDDYVKETIDEDNLFLAFSGSTTTSSVTTTSSANLSSEFFTLAPYFTKIGSDDESTVDTSIKSSNLSPSYELRNTDNPLYLTLDQINEEIKIDWTKGTISDPYGVLYPQHGFLLIFPELITNSQITTSFNDTDNPRALNVLNSLMYIGGYGKNKSEKMLLITNLKFDEFNYTHNPTTYEIVGGRKRKKEIFIDNPTTFVTQIGVYNQQNELLATANLSKPDKKDQLEILSYKITIEI